jgi:hypothetical protein
MLAVETHDDEVLRHVSCASSKGERASVIGQSDESDTVAP